MVTFQEQSRFYSRNSGGKYPLDVGEIRSAFALSESLPEKIRRFRDERIARIVAGETPISLPAGHIRFALHLVPISSFYSPGLVDMSAISAAHEKLRPLAYAPTGFRVNFEGFLTYSGQPGSGLAYSQLFRNGSIEGVEGGGCEVATARKGALRFAACEEWVIRGLTNFLEVEARVGILPPIIVMLTILGVKGTALTVERSLHSRGLGVETIDRDTLLLPDLLVEDYSQPPDRLLRPALDVVWQAAGWQRSPSYDEDGNWRSR
jgi:hypothetical protein